VSTVYSRRNLTWVRNGTAWVTRHNGIELARAVPDQKYAGMWRVRFPDGRLSDLANITWAKDAAATMALAVLNRTAAPHCASGDARNDAGDAAQATARSTSAPRLTRFAASIEGAMRIG